SCHATVMVMFITALIAVTGTYAAPLLNLYLLPVIGMALSLGRAAALFQILLVVACRLVLTIFIGDESGAPLNYALNLTVELAPILLAALLITNLASDVRVAETRVQAATDRDDLTGLLNMQTFTRLAENEYERAKRRGSSFAVLMIDVDGLRAVNEKYGPEGGNRTLVAVADAISRSVRHLDFVGRYGGDKFVVYLDGATEAVAEAVRNRIRHNTFATMLDVHHNLKRTSVTAGIACFPKDGRDIWALVDCAGRDIDRERQLRRANTERQASKFDTLK
ncbi:MAG: GGDEF domain-containing protein, partial [Gammaproteobacteria bacterium]